MTWLTRIARLFFDEDTMNRVVLPTLADLEHEVREAGDDARARRVARIRGYVAFWKLVVLSPFAFADWPGRRQFVQSLTHVVAIAVLLVVTLGAKSEWLWRWLAGWASQIQQMLPTLYSVADLGPYVWLLTPIAVVVLAVLGWRSPFRAPLAIVLVGAATIAAAITYGAIGFLAGFDGIAARGSAGVGAVIPAVDALAIPVLLSLAIAFVAAIAAAISQVLFRERSAPGAAVHSSSPIAGLVLTLSVAVALFAVNQWLLMNEELLDVALGLTVRRVPGGGRELAGRSEIAIPLMLFGFVVAATILVAALAAWRGSRASHPNLLLQWTARLAIVAVLAGCAWHANVIGNQWQMFRAGTSSLRASLR